MSLSTRTISLPMWTACHNIVSDIGRRTGASLPLSGNVASDIGKQLTDIANDVGILTLEADVGYDPIPLLDSSGGFGDTPGSMVTVASQGQDPGPSSLGGAGISALRGLCTTVGCVT